MKKSILLLALIVVMASFVACNSTEAVEPVASEPASSSEEFSEPASEEVSSEEEIKEVEVVNFSTFDEFVGHVKNSGKATIAEFNFFQEGSSQMIIHNEAHHTMQWSNNLYLITSKEVSAIEKVDTLYDGNFYIKEDFMDEGVCLIEIGETRQNIEVPIKVKYSDGTEEDILFYVANTFEEQLFEAQFLDISLELISKVSSNKEVVGDSSIYTKDSIMKLADDLIAKYPNENPEHIKATLIMTNLDKISVEDRTVLLETYGFTYESLERTMLEFFDSLYQSYNDTISYYNGAERLKDTANFEERMPITEFVLATEDQVFAQRLSDFHYGHATLNTIGCSSDGIIIFYECTKGYCSSFTDIILYIYACFGQMGSEEIPYEAYGIDTGM